MNKNVNAEALTNEELEQTAGGAVVYTDNGYYVTPDQPVPTIAPSTPSIPVISPSPAPAIPTISSGGSTYTVQKGDTLGKIAKKFGKTVASLKALNNIQNENVIYAGQVLRIS